MYRAIQLKFYQKSIHLKPKRCICNIMFVNPKCGFSCLFTIFSGKSSALGHKQPCPNGQWNELAITKASKFVQCAVGHEGGHSLLLTEDGIVYFVGIPRRGEDGDQTKARRILKPSKPKIFNRMDGQFVSYVSQIFVLF